MTFINFVSVYSKNTIISLNQTRVDLIRLNLSLSAGGTGQEIEMSMWGLECKVFVQQLTISTTRQQLNFLANGFMLLT